MKDRLEIFLITYNRAKYLRGTLEQVLAEDSPVRDFRITVLDNKSTDETREVVMEFQRIRPNLRYLCNPYNIGGNANIVRAMELGTMEYRWTICDDDKYDWSAWPEVEQAVAEGAKLICASNHYLKADESASEISNALRQMTFLPSIIAHESLFSDTTIKNAYDEVCFLFPHLQPVVAYLNHGGKIRALTKSIVRIWEHEVDASFVRGAVRDELVPRYATMSIPVGFANAVASLKNRDLAKKCFKDMVYGCQVGRLAFYGGIFFNLRGLKNKMNFTDIWMQSTLSMKCILLGVRIIQESPLYHLIASRRIYDILRSLADRRNKRKLLSV